MRFVLADGDRTLLDWPNIDWPQTWRLVHLFAKIDGPGATYIYNDDPIPPPPPRVSLREIQRRVWRFGMPLDEYHRAVAEELAR